MTALANLLFAAASFETTGRRVLMWSKVSAQPAIFLRNVEDTYERRDHLPSKVTMHAEIWIYSKSGANPDIAPGIALNNLVDAVEAVLAPDNVLTNRLTLGGLVQHVWIAGKIDYDP